METKSAMRFEINGLFDRRIKPIQKVIKIGFKLPYLSSLDNVFASRFTMDIPTFRRCTVCNVSQSENQLNYCSEMFVCDECKKDYFRDCDECHQPMVFENIPHMTIDKQYRQVTNTEGKLLFVCSSCISSIYEYCDVCKKYLPENMIKETKVANNTTSYLCPDCLKDFNDKTKRCSNCHGFFSPEKMKGSLCIECHIQSITKQSAKKDISGYGKTEGKIFLTTKDSGDCLGVEIEVSDGIESDALKIALNEYPEVVLKRDGSVPRGFEIVSYPLSLGYHKSMMKWLKLFDLLNANGYKSHDTSSCGFHVHMSRLAFGDTTRKQSKFNAFFLYLVESNQVQFKKFSRRTEYGYCNFYNLNYSNTTVTRAYQSAVNRNRNQRFMVLNYQNKNTVEFRLFKGTINYGTFIATLELIEHMKSICLSCKNESDIRSYTWQKIVATIPAEYQNLKSYLAKRNLMA